MPTTAEEEAALARAYDGNLARTGLSYTGEQLRQAVLKESKIEVSLSRIYEFLRRHPEAGVASLQARSTKPARHQTIGVTKAGVFFIDYGEFHKSWAGGNNGCTGFLVAVENLSNRLFVHPTRGKDTRQWLDSIARFIELTRDVKIIFSDRDSVATSPAFRTHVEKKYQIRWRFLKKGNKSFLAERYIRYVKEKLSQALVASGASDKPRKRWVDYVEDLCRVYNQQYVPGTRYRRGAISDSNFDAFAGQLFGSSNLDLDRFNAFAAGPFQNDDWNKRAFKFQIGDKVLLLRKADWKKGGTATFAKPSLVGAYGPVEYTVSGRQLRADRNFKTLVPVYSLEEFDGGDRRQLHFYENELVLRGGRRDGKQDYQSDRQNDHSVRPDVAGRKRGTRGRPAKRPTHRPPQGDADQSGRLQQPATQPL